MLRFMLSRLSRCFPHWNRLDRHIREVIRGASVAFVLRVAGAGLGFGFNVVLARLLGAEGAGVYYLALTVTTIATVVGRMGLDNALLRFVAANAAQGDWRKVVGVYRRGMLLALSMSTVATAVLLLSAPWIASHLFAKPLLAQPLRIMALSILPMSLLTLHGELLKAVHKPGHAMLVQAVGVPLVGMLLLVLLGRPLGVLGAVIAYAVATSLVFFIALLLWREATPQLKGMRGEFDAWLLIKTSLPLFWVASMNLVMSWTDTVMLGIWVDSKAVGVYSVAARTASLTAFVLVAVNSVVAPKFAALYAQRDLQALGLLARSSAKLMIILSSPLLALFIVAPGQVLGIFGPEFMAGAWALAILAMGQFVNVATGSVGYLLMMSGYEKLMQYNISGSAVLNVALNVLLIPRYGVVGAALATSISLAFMNIVSAILVVRKLSILPVALPRRMINDR